MTENRSAARLALVTLAAAVLVPLTGTTAAHATPGCVDETVPSLLQDGCDDSTPPETTVAASTTPNAQGLVNVSAITFTLGASVTDGDAGPFGFECKVTGPVQSHDWQACSSPVAMAGLVDGQYAFEARAVDLGDRARNPDTPLGLGTVADTPDHDHRPAVVRWGQDTKAPFVFVTGTTYDEATPTQPVVTGPAVPIRLNSSEPGSTVECLDNDEPVACSPGRWQLEGARAGRHVFTARTIDPAGNPSTWSDPIEFFVPRDVRRQRGWTKVADDGYVGGDAVTASRRGARLVLPRTKVGELRLIAPTGPRYGTVRVRVGKRAWHVVDLSGTASRLEQHVVIDRYSGMRSGRIVIESLSSRPVVVDAVVARPNRFPAATRAPARWQRGR